MTGAAWHPAESERVLSSASDGTLRTWDLNGPTALEGRLVCETIYKVKSGRGVRCSATACSWDPDGDRIAGGAQDGSVQLWSPRGTGSTNRPDALMRDAHSGDVTCVAFAPSGRLLASRGDDDRVCIWDIRKTAAPLHAFGDVESLFQTSNVAWAPDSRHVCAGTSVRKGQGSGRLKFFDAQLGGAPVADLAVCDGGSLIQVLWHPVIKQVLCSTSTGTMKVCVHHIYYILFF